MSAELKFTVEEYFALERTSKTRYEYFDGRIVAMSGTSANHNRITADVTTLLNVKLRDRSCEIFAADQRVKVSDSPYLYPDVVAVCGTSKFEKIGGVEALINPVLIIEVLSPTTIVRDEGIKFEQYRSIESLK